ncbi:hypothetical protein F0562_028896 [Nyssa sinensis]|uniref:Non-haem dioxygenase N-terminal domain-containing protein n=1 Tax=Nyssa sinensis TaxID=561372 RepID=A0A5J5B1E7_9ASTE|nr:hypothetical protein F0562_028896 [Nyssa sinensis]
MGTTRVLSIQNSSELAPQEVAKTCLQRRQRCTSRDGRAKPPELSQNLYPELARACASRGGKDMPPEVAKTCLQRWQSQTSRASIASRDGRAKTSEVGLQRLLQKYYYNIYCPSLSLSKMANKAQLVCQLAHESPRHAPMLTMVKSVAVSAELTIIPSNYTYSTKPIEPAASDLEEDPIPVIDFSLLTSGNPDQQSKFIQDLGKACEDWGGFMVMIEA